MGKVKELLMDIQEKTWEAIEKYPAIEFDALVKEVAVATNQEEKFIAPIVESEYLDYKNGVGNDEGYDGYGAEYENENTDGHYEGK